MTKKEQSFIDTVWEYYCRHGRHNLPWRKKLQLKPYNILVSEIMLQQTQVERVVPKYQAFVKRWPTAKQLASASLGDVLRAWQGLGYNRRAKALHECAKRVSSECTGQFPREYAELLALPGIGPYTAGAVRAFAFNLPTPLIETNIRTVYLHHFFNTKIHVSDAEILQMIDKTLNQSNPREWYWALMDYGSFLKKEYKVKNTNSAQYTKQSKFKGSDREIRGAILRELTQQSLTRRGLEIKLYQFEKNRIKEQLQTLEVESLVIKVATWYQLP